ncbi:Neurofibromin 1 [Balamuthia mandrillaris]
MSSSLTSSGAGALKKVALASSGTISASSTGSGANHAELYPNLLQLEQMLVSNLSLQRFLLAECAAIKRNAATLANAILSSSPPASSSPPSSPPSALALSGSAGAGKSPEEYGRALAQVLCYNGQALPLMRHIISHDVLQAKSPAMLLRFSNMEMKVLTQFLFADGRVFLEHYVPSIVLAAREVVAKGGSFELDGLKAAPEENIEKNREHLHRLAEQAFTTIVNSVHLFSPRLRVLCKHLGDCSEQRFAGSRFIGVSSLLFLHFLNPALANPVHYNLVSEINAAEHRGLLLVVKLLQNLVNEQLFKKEPYMLPFNDFITNKIPVLHNFYASLLEISEPLTEARDTTRWNCETMVPLYELISESMSSLCSSWSQQNEENKLTFSKLETWMKEAEKEAAAFQEERKRSRVKRRTSSRPWKAITGVIRKESSARKAGGTRKGKNRKVFGVPLATLMERQRETHPGVRVPLAIIALAEATALNGGCRSEGIFRQGPPFGEMTKAIEKLEHGDLDYVKTNHSPHVPACMLKKLFRDLPTPLVPLHYAQRCKQAVANIEEADDHNELATTANTANGKTATWRRQPNSPKTDQTASSANTDSNNENANIINTKETPIDIVLALPELEREIMIYMVEFLQRTMLAEEVVKATKMTDENLAMVFSPCLIRVAEHEGCAEEDMASLLAGFDMQKRFLLYVLRHWNKPSPSASSSPSSPPSSSSSSSSSTLVVETGDGSNSNNSRQLSTPTPMPTSVRVVAKDGEKSPPQPQRGVVVQSGWTRAYGKTQRNSSPPNRNVKQQPSHAELVVVYDGVEASLSSPSASSTASTAVAISTQQQEEEEQEKQMLQEEQERLKKMEEDLVVELAKQREIEEERRSWSKLQVEQEEAEEQEQVEYLERAGKRAQERILQEPSTQGIKEEAEDGEDVEEEEGAEREESQQEEEERKRREQERARRMRELHVEERRMALEDKLWMLLEEKRKERERIRNEKKLAYLKEILRRRKEEEAAAALQRQEPPQLQQPYRPSPLSLVSPRVHVSSSSTTNNRTQLPYNSSLDRISRGSPSSSPPSPYPTFSPPSPAIATRPHTSPPPQIQIRRQHPQQMNAPPVVPPLGPLLQQTKASAHSCKACGLEIHDEFLRLDSATYHNHCFLCGHCKTPLGTQSFYIVGPAFLCAGCYGSGAASSPTSTSVMAPPTCHGCRASILTAPIPLASSPSSSSSFPLREGDAPLSALGKHWHTRCFRCLHCGCTIGTQSKFVSKGSQPVCLPCYSRSSSSPSSPSASPYPSPSPSPYPSPSPSPSSSSSSIPTLNSFHHPQRTSAKSEVCSKCNAGFGPGESFLMALGKHWHSGCFLCSVCYSPLLPSAFYVTDNALRCATHR